MASRKGSPNKSTLEIKAILAEKVDFGRVVEKLVELVDGVTVQETLKNGDEIIYTKVPDSKAALILLEYGFGKPSQSIDVTSDGERLATPMIIDWNENKTDTEADRGA